MTENPSPKFRPKTLAKRNRSEARKKRRVIARNSPLLKLKDASAAIPSKAPKADLVGQEVKLVGGNYPKSYIGRKALVLGVDGAEYSLQVPGRKSPLKVSSTDVQVCVS